MEYYENGAMTIKLDDELPEYPAFLSGYRRAPRREAQLSEADKALAIRNALRYIHPKHHAQMAEEFARELEEQAVSTATASAPRASSTASPLTSIRVTAWRPRPCRS